MEFVEARRALGAAIAFSLLRPVYPALGCGKLRVLRVTPSKEDASDQPTPALEIVAGYESYERIDL